MVKNLVNKRKILGTLNKNNTTDPLYDNFKVKFKKFDSADLITAFYALEHHMFDAFDTPESQNILEAIRRSTVDLDNDASVDEIADYIQNFDDDQIDGLVNNIKGIYHEIQFVYDENNDDNSIRAELFGETNHEGSDVILIDTETGEREYVQLKATFDVNYVREALEKNPDIRVISTEELAEKLEIESSGMSNDELNRKVEEAIENLDNREDLLDYIPAATIWSTTFAILPLVNKYIKKQITKKDCLQGIAKITGYKAVRVAALLILLSTPLTAIPTSTYLIAKYASMVVRTFQQKS
jgi:hypothetical protein